MGFGDMLQQLFWGRRPAQVGLPGAAPRPRRPFRAARIVPGARVVLTNPIAGPHTVWIPAGAAGVVVGGDTKAKKARVELDQPRTVITVPWAWLEDEPETPEAAPAP